MTDGSGNDVGLKPDNDDGKPGTLPERGRLCLMGARTGSVGVTGLCGESGGAATSERSPVSFSKSKMVSSVNSSVNVYACMLL